MILKCRKGRHSFVFTGWLGWLKNLLYRLPVNNPNKVGFRTYFRKDTRYDLDSNDQKDWNKLAGISFNYRTNHNNSAMLGWRYNLLKDVFEVTIYAHINGSEKFDFIEPIEVEIGQELVYAYYPDYNRNTCNIKIWLDEENIVDYTIQYEDISGKWNRKIGVYFGGNRTAPKTLYIGQEEASMWINNTPFF